jgi:hypothetical protein
MEGLKKHKTRDDVLRELGEVTLAIYEIISKQKVYQETQDRQLETVNADLSGMWNFTKDDIHIVVPKFEKKLKPLPRDFFFIF